jgi:hypothetical protein
MIPIISQVLEIVNKYIPDPNQRIKAETELLSALGKSDQNQSEVNKAEAANGSVFVSGWRPFIGWVCGSAMAYQYVLSPIVMWIAPAFGFYPPEPPKLDDVLWELLFGMLGIAGLRTYEKLKGVTK